MGSRRTLPTAARGGGGHFRAHGGADVDTGAPVEGLVDQRHGGGAAAAEDDGADRHALGVFPGRVDGRALRGGSGEARIGMRGLGSGLLGDLGRPLISLPVEALRGRLVGHALPPDAAFGRERDVGEDGVARERGHRVRVGLDATCPGATPKKPASGLIARSRPSASGLIQAMSSPTVQTFQPSKPAGGISMAKFVLPQALGKAAAT